MNDFSRLARRISGKSIGLVLGGGGARGIAHLVRSYNKNSDCADRVQGLIRAMEEYGIPIDHIAGEFTEASGEMKWLSMIHRHKYRIIHWRTIRS